MNVERSLITLNYGMLLMIMQHSGTIGRILFRLWVFNI